MWQHPCEADVGNGPGRGWAISVRAGMRVCSAVFRGGKMRYSRTFAHGTRQDEAERRVRTSVFLPRLTVADGVWLGRTLPSLQRNARPEPQAVRVEDVALRYRSGRLGIADALDATSTLLEPFAAAGATLEHRGEWYIADEDDDDDDSLES